MILFNRIILTSTSLLILGFTPQYAQTPDTFWTKTYGGAENDAGLSVKQTPYDNGYIIAGYTRSFGGGGRDVYLIKTDENGDTLWTRTIGYDYDETGYSVVQSADSGYVISGNWYNAPLANLKFWKVDMNGSSLWNKTYDMTERDYGREIQRTTDGGFVAVGAVYTEGQGSIILIKTDSYGDTLWLHTYAFGQEGRSVQQTADGGYIITGDIIANLYFDVVLIKTNSSGNTLWTKAYGGSYWDEGHSVRQTNDGGYIIAGRWGASSNDYDVYIIKTDSNGNPDWTKTYGGTSWDCAHSVQQTFDGGYIVAGYRYALTGHADVWLLKTDSNGDTLWTRIYGGTANDQARSVLQTSDGGYIITGYTESFGTGARDVWLLKTEPDTLSLAENQIRNPQISFLGISPNPFEEKTSIRYQTVKDNTDIKMQIYDITGRLVKTLFPPSTNSLLPTVVSWNGRNDTGDELSSGVYFLTLEARNYAKTIKLLLIK